ncbi:MAG: hypothetical protein KAT65_10970, partial [Methanophagales archaeon]|nr:hypothetical protein [Methanophagales archaeon]
MRGKVAVAVIVVLACALFLVPYASAAAKLTIIDTWVEGPSGEVLDEYTYVDVNGDCTYKVEVKIEDSSFWPIILTVNLAFGPNYGDRSCQDDMTEKDIRIYDDKTTTTICFADISLSTLDYCDEAFKEFVDGKGGWKWDKCWYQFDVEAMMIEGAQTGIKRGIPVLTNAEVIYYNSHVGQNRVYKDLSFDYHVKVWANCEDSIELQVRNYTSG